MRKLLFILLFIVSCITMNRARAQVYARGSFCSWGTDYTMMPYSPDTLLAQCVYMPVGENELKFANTDYSVSWGGSTGLSGIAVPGASPNIVYTVTASGYYNVFFDSTTFFYNITPLPYTASNAEMYVSGNFNGWGTTNRMVLVGNHTWQTTAPIALTAMNDTLKFRNDPAWAGNDWGGASGLTGTAILTTGGGPNLTANILIAGNYTFTFNDSSLQYSIILIPSAYTGGAVVTTSISPVIDSTEPVTITFHPYWDTLTGYPGDNLLRYTSGSVYLYAGVLTNTSAGGWVHTNTTGWGASDPYYEMTKVDSNTYTYTFPNLRSYYTLVGTSPEIDSIALIFTSGNGDTQTSNIFIPLTPEVVTYVSTGPMVTTTPSSIIDSDEDVVIHFHPYWDTLGGTTGDATLRSFGGTIFIYTGLYTIPSTGDWNHTNPTWAASGSYYAMTKVDSNDYTYNLVDLRAFYGLGADTMISTVNVIFKDSLGTIQSSTVYLPVTEPAGYLTSGPVVTTSISPVIDSTEPVVITFHPFRDTMTGYAGDSLLRHTTGNVYLYTGILTNTSAGGWVHTNTTGWGASDPYYEMTKVDSNTYTYTFPNLRSYYTLVGTSPEIDSVALIFTSGNGDTQTSNIFIPVTPEVVTSVSSGPMVTTTPSSIIDSDEDVVIHFHPYWDTLGGTTGDATLRNFGGTIFIYTGLYTIPSTGDWNHTNPTWAASGSYYAMTKVDSNDYTYNLADLRAFYGIGADTMISTVNVIFKDSLGTIQSSTVYLPVTEPASSAVGGPVVTTSIAPVIDSTEPVTITFHPYWDTLTGYPGDNLLRHTTGDVYLYTGVLPNPTPIPGGWIHTNTTGWGASDPYYKMTRIDSNTYTYTFPDLRAYYSLAGTDTTIDSIAVIFTSGNGDTQTSNIFIPVMPITLPPPVTGPAVTTSISPVIDSSEGVTITFHPFWDTLTGYSGDSLFRSATSALYLYTGVLTSWYPGIWEHTNTTGWGASDPYYRMTRLDSNTYTYTLPDIRSYYGLAGTDTLIDSIALIVSTGNGTMQTSNFYIPLVAASVAANVGVPVVTISSSAVSMLLLPNPTTSNVSAIISIGNNTDGTIRVMNQMGQCVLTKAVTSPLGKVILPLNDLPAGIYFVELAAGDKKVVQRLIKE